MTKSVNRKKKAVRKKTAKKIATSEPRKHPIITKLEAELEGLVEVFTKHCKKAAEKYGVNVQITVGFELKPPSTTKEI